MASDVPDEVHGGADAVAEAGEGLVFCRNLDIGQIQQTFTLSHLTRDEVGFLFSITE